ncbi:MAG: CCA tRNA nucleotidyltransferase [Phycisphaeraceae bacterium]|nr:MAG: CCA tRNA nucleotidyltransferase [Phycisphaeraceae bacterium]
MTSAREAARSIVRRLVDAGHVAYFAGGCVRDELLGDHPEDYDVATDATPEQVEAMFRRTRAVGKVFGVVLVTEDGHTIEVATFRREHGYSDSRRPDGVVFTDAEEDARRRDFTINALFLDPLDTGERAEGRIIDFVGGLGDLDARVIRAVGDPDERLGEDHLRALRAVRFAARLGFRIDESTSAAIHRHAVELRGVSRERIGDELRRMLSHPRREGAVSLMQRLGLDAPVLEESGLPRAPTATVGGLPREASFSLGLAAWCADRAGVPGGPDGEPVGAVVLRTMTPELVRRLRRALCLTNDERDRLRQLLTDLVRVEDDWAGLGVAAKKRLAASEHFPELLALCAARDPSTATGVRSEVGALAADGVGLAPPALLTGDHLVEQGFSPGPGFARWLESVYDAQLEGRIRTLEEALALAENLRNSGG